MLAAPRKPRSKGLDTDGFRARPAMRLLAVGALGIALTLAGGATQSVLAAPSKKPVAVPGELVVGFEAGVSEAAQAEVLAQAGVTKKKGVKQIRAALVGVSEKRATAVAKALADDPRVRYVEPNHVITTAVIPDDPSFGQLWGLNNTGQTGGTPDADIDAPEAWNVATGSSNVVVAVVDTGVDFGHPDLAAQQWVNPGENCGSSDPEISCPERTNGIDDDNDRFLDDWRGWDFVSGDNNPVDDHNHGTHVAGTIGAVGNNGTGITGVNWNVRIMALKFLDASGSGDSFDAAAATTYAVDHGAAIANNSWGGGPPEQVLEDAVDYADAHGMLFVAAAGNDGANNDASPFYPASYDSDGLVAVAATDANDNLASFSNYGAKSVDLAAPGAGILSTTRGGGYQSFSGTSMATPHVVGAAALVKAHFPAATAYGMKALLFSSVDPKSSLAGKVVTGGRLNVGNALSCSNAPRVWLDAPRNGFAAGLGDAVPVKVLATNCAVPAGVGNVSVTVNGSPVALSASSPDTGLYSGTFTPSAEGALTVTAAVTVGGSTATQTANGTAVRNYTCQEIEDPWVNVTGGTRLSGASDSDDGFSAVNITFPFSFYGSSYSTAHVSANGFLTLGSSTGADAYANVGIPSSSPPNGVIAPFWDDLDPTAQDSGAVFTGVTGSSPNRVLHVEWSNLKHWSLNGSGTATFELSLYQATGEIRFRYLDTDFGNSTWNAGASATAGLENLAGTIGRELSFNQSLLTSGKEISCTLGAAPPPPPPAPTITTTNLADATNATVYSQTLAASGGTPPYSWSIVSGDLPSGLSLNLTTGAITGTPDDTVGPKQFMAQVTDSGSQSDTQDLVVALADPLTVTTTSLPGGTVGQAYSQVVAATGGKSPYAWSLATGSLPPGLALNASTGAVTGTPTTAGTFGFTVQATDAGNPVRTATQALSISLVAPLTITTTSLAAGTVGQSYSQTLSASGGQTPYTWSVASGSLPPGLSLNSATGAVTGTPTAAGTYGFVAQVTDGAQTDTQTLSITVSSTAALVISSWNLPGGKVGSTYSGTVTASGGATPYTWSVASGMLPPGLGLVQGTPAMTISGTPTTVGRYTFTIRVTDTLGTQQTRTFQVRIKR